MECARKEDTYTKREQEGEIYTYQNEMKGIQRLLASFHGILLINSEILGYGLEIPSRCCPERRKIRLFKWEDFRVSNVTTRHMKNDLISKSRALNKSFLSAL